MTERLRRAIEAAKSDPHWEGKVLLDVADAELILARLQEAEAKAATREAFESECG